MQVALDAPAARHGALRPDETRSILRAFRPKPWPTDRAAAAAELGQLGIDAGAYAVICPMVNTREDAQKLVSWTHYVPRGTRSFGPVRALLYGGADYAQHANDTVVAFAMIETAQALENLDAIMSVEGLDAIYIGPSDLSISLGCRPTMDDLEPKAQQAVDHVLARAKVHGLVAGIHNTGPESALKRIAAGFQFVTVSSDARLIASGARQVMAKMRAGVVPSGTSATY